MAKLPSFQFYPGDWMKDPGLRSCSAAARGLWMDMLCLMFESDRRGFLQAPNGKPYSHDQLARMTGCSPDEISLLLAELETSGVYSRTTHGTIFSRRLLRDEEKRADARGRQNTFRKSHKTKKNSNADVTHDVTHLSHPSSSSTSVLKTTPLASPSSFTLPLWIPPDVWEAFEEMRKKIRAPLTDRARQGTIRDLEKLGKSGHDTEACLLQSVTRAYRGVFAVKQDDSPKSGPSLSNPRFFEDQR